MTSKPRPAPAGPLAWRSSFSTTDSRVAGPRSNGGAERDSLDRDRVDDSRRFAFRGGRGRGQWRGRGWYRSSTYRPVTDNGPRTGHQRNLHDRHDDQYRDNRTKPSTDSPIPRHEHSNFRSSKRKLEDRPRSGYLDEREMDKFDRIRQRQRQRPPPYRLKTPEWRERLPSKNNENGGEWRRVTSQVPPPSGARETSVTAREVTHERDRIEDPRTQREDVSTRDHEEVAINGQISERQKVIDKPHKPDTPHDGQETGSHQEPVERDGGVEEDTSNPPLETEMPTEPTVDPNDGPDEELERRRASLNESWLAWSQKWNEMCARNPILGATKDREEEPRHNETRDIREWDGERQEVICATEHACPPSGPLTPVTPMGLTDNGLDVPAPQADLPILEQPVAVQQAVADGHETSLCEDPDTLSEAHDNVLLYVDDAHKGTQHLAHPDLFRTHESPGAEESDASATPTPNDMLVVDTEPLLAFPIDTPSPILADPATSLPTPESTATPEERAESIRWLDETSTKLNPKTSFSTRSEKFVRALRAPGPKPTSAGRAMALQILRARGDVLKARSAELEREIEKNTITRRQMMMLESDAKGPKSATSISSTDSRWCAKTRRWIEHVLAVDKAALEANERERRQLQESLRGMSSLAAPVKVLDGALMCTFHS